MDNNFYTFHEYMKKANLSAAMEDYIEMIYRLSADTGFTRIHKLAEALNVQPSSATKMIQKLASLGYLEYEKYEVIRFKDNGVKIGAQLLKRHLIIEKFLRLIGIDDEDVLEETEKIEHTLSAKTIIYLEQFVDFMDSNPEVVNSYINLLGKMRNQD
jgi:Mn-dependent DtxR family transcriptional regulator